MGNSDIQLEQVNELKKELEELKVLYEEACERKSFYGAQVQQQYAIIDALSEDFSAIYVIAKDNKFIIPIKKQTIWKHIETPDDIPLDTDAKIKAFINENVFLDDREALLNILNFDDIYSMLEKQSRFYHHFRMMRDGKVHYYYLKISGVRSGENLDAVMFGLVCEDESKEKETLRTLSETDIMTQLYNRGTGEKKTRELISAGTTGMFCMMDLDHFKMINDNLGHAMGDEVLKQFAKELKAAFRNDDIVFRLGGDEFAVFAPGIVSRRVGMRILKELVGKVSAINIPELKDIKIEVSIGALITEGLDNDFESAYNKADAGIYISKKGSGNAITFCPDNKCIIV